MSENTTSKIRAKYVYPIVTLLIIGAMIAYFELGGFGNMETVKIGNVVAVDYTGTLDDGSVFDTSDRSVAARNGIEDPRRTYEPLEFTVGNGEMIKGFDNAVVGMRAGETKKISLQPKDAYGDVRQDYIVTVNASDIESGGRSLAVGGKVFLETGAEGRIIKIESGKATVDFNHPMAGKVLNFEIKLVKIMS